MGAALGLSVMLLVVVGVLSIAVNAQGPVQAGPATRGGHPGSGRGPRSPGGRAATHRPEGEGQPRGFGRSAGSGKSRSARRETPPEPLAPDVVAPPSEPEPEPVLIVGDVKPLDTEATARVMSVVDERKLGPVTKSKLTLLVDVPGSKPFEVVARVAFTSPQERARVKVGATVPVRYDSGDHRRVVVEMDRGKD